MRSRLRRPEKAVLVPQHQRIKLRGERRRLLPKRFEPQRLGRFHGLPLRLVALRGHGGGGEGGRRRWRRRGLQGWIAAVSGEKEVAEIFRQVATGGMASRPCSPPLIEGGVGERALRLSK